MTAASAEPASAAGTPAAGTLAAGTRAAGMPAAGTPAAGTTLGRVLADQAAAHADRALFVCENLTFLGQNRRAIADDSGPEIARLTYRAAEQESGELAKALLALGVGRSNHVGILMPSSAGFLTTFFAVTRIGAVAVPLSTFSTPSELQWLIRHANVSVLLTARSFRSHDFLATLQEALPGLEAGSKTPLYLREAPSLRRVFIEADPALMALAAGTSDEQLAAVEADVSPADRLVIVHTSGSTSAPKGVIHTHGGLINHVQNLNRLRRLEAGMGYFSMSPLFWIGGLAYNVIGVLTAGATLVTSVATDASRTLDLLEQERPEMVNGFAAGVAHLAKDPSFARRDLSFIRTGNLWPIMPEAIRPADPDLRHNMLGMTESGSVTLMDPDESDQPEHRRGSFGRPVTDLAIRIVDPDTGAVCTVDGAAEAGRAGPEPGMSAVGELWLRGPMIMEGYYGRERHEVFDADGWFNTGDLFAQDSEGFLYYKGRRGDMIKTSGANVSPREVEAALREVLPDEMAIVLGLPDAERGQKVVAVVIAPAATTVDEAAVTAALKTRLSAYKVPRRIFHLTEVPMLSSGKIDSKKLIGVLSER